MVYIHKQTLKKTLYRYNLYSSRPKPKNITAPTVRGTGQTACKLSGTDVSKAYLNHIQYWGDIRKVSVHSTSKKLLNAPELYANFSLALACITCIPPCHVKSKKSQASYKMMKGSVLGASCTLRTSSMLNFCYKWAFLAPEANIDFKATHGQGYGLNSIFVFELDILDYDAFEPVPGCDISFHK